MISVITEARTISVQTAIERPRLSLCFSATGKSFGQDPGGGIIQFA
jgi:hypothetical protein